MRIRHIVPSLEDRHGGPSRSVRALANAEAALGDAVEVLTTSPEGTPPDGGPDAATIRVFPRIAPRRLCRSPGLAAAAAEGACDSIHHHSLWLLTLRYAADAARRNRVPLVISPRGMFSGWALQHHRWRKRLAALFVHPGAFTAASGWHATSDAEADDIRRLGFTQPVCVAPNGVSLPTAASLAAAREAWRQACPAARGRRVAVFYSRFHRKKRLRELVDLWLARPRGDWFLLIAGVPEEYSVADIEGWIARANAQDRLAVFSGSGRPAPFAFAELSLLPSHSENFGLVIAESLAAGVPALVTDTTPWSRLTPKAAGWCVPWSGFSVALEQALAHSPAGLAAMGAAGRQWMANEFGWEKSACLLREFRANLVHA